MAYTGVSPAMTGGFSQFLATDYKKIFFDNYRRRVPEYTRVAKVQNVSQHSWKEGSAMVFGAHQQLAEGQAPDFDVIVQGPEKEVTFTQYALGFEMTRNMYRDDQTGNFKKIPAELGKSANYTLDTLFWDIFNSGFVTTARTGIDAGALFASHTQINGDTQSNLGTAATLGETALELGLNAFEALENENGIPIEMKPNLLIIPYQLKWAAKRLLLSEFRPGSMDNDINALKDEGLQYYVCHYLTSSTAWFLLSPDHDLRHMWRDNVEFDSGDDFRTKNAMFTSMFRCAEEFWDWRGAWGNAGA